MEPSSCLNRGLGWPLSFHKLRVDQLCPSVGAVGFGYGHPNPRLTERETFSKPTGRRTDRSSGLTAPRCDHGAEKHRDQYGDGLTDRQDEALRIAYEWGHFDIPRRASLEDVAEELGITPSSVSERLRRA